MLLAVVVLVLGGMPVGGQDCEGCGPEEPDHGGGCRICEGESPGSPSQCSKTQAEWGEPSWVCLGGMFCYPTPTGTVCQPYCGELRCSSI